MTVFILIRKLKLECGNSFVTVFFELCTNNQPSTLGRYSRNEPFETMAAS